MIINLTQHKATPEQIAAGVVDLDEEMLKNLKNLLTVESLPSRAEILQRAEALAELAQGLGAHQVMIGGAMWLMAPLERALLKRGITPHYAFSQRRSEEEHRPDGSVEKRQIFRHGGFVPAVVEK